MKAQTLRLTQTKLLVEQRMMTNFAAKYLYCSQEVAVFDHSREFAIEKVVKLGADERQTSWVAAIDVVFKELVNGNNDKANDTR